MTRTSRTRFLLAWTGGALVTALVMATLPAAADGDPATDGVGMVLPYQGYLEEGGEPVDADVDMSFTLYDGDTQRFSERRTVSVFAGSFTVLLGDTSATSSADLETALENADALELEVTVHASDGDRVLDNRKPLTVAPWAMLSRTLVEPTIGGQLVIEADLVVADDSSAAPFVITDSDGAQLLLDGDEVDSDGVLQLNTRSGGALQLGGDLIIEDGVIKMTDGDGDLVEVLRATTDGELIFNYDAGAADHILIDSPAWFNATIDYASKVNGLTSSVTVNEDSCQTFDLTGTSGELTQSCTGARAWVGGEWGANVLNGSKGLRVMKCCTVDTVTVK